MYYYISDLHFFHENILKLSKRPFLNIDDMHLNIINNWNSLITDRDTVYILGDIAYLKNIDYLSDLTNLIKKLKGKKVLIYGNHDMNLLNKDEFCDLFVGIYNYLEISDFGKKIILFHYPIEEWNDFFKGSIHLHGHVHNNPVSPILNRYNVSADCINFKPVSLKDLVDI